MKTITVLRDGRPATPEELLAAVEGRPLPPVPSKPLFCTDVANELYRAREKHEPINSLHEGYAVLLEELDELWEHVRRKNTDHAGNRDAYRELVQIAAMAQRVAEDVVQNAELTGSKQPEKGTA